MKLTSTKTSIKYIKCIVYGKPGVGKTVLGSTAPNPIIIDAERGLLSISNKDLPVIRINDFDDLEETYNFLSGKKGRKFDTVVIDSASEVAEFVLADLKREAKDARQAYMALGERAIELFRAFRDLDKHVVYICKAKAIDDDGVQIYKPSFPGTALIEKVPYLVDEMFALRIADEEEGGYRYVQTQPSFSWDSKDRSGKLEDMEEPNLSKIFRKILKK